MSTHQFAHVLLGVPLAVQLQIRDYMNDDSVRGEAVRAVLDTLDPNRICNVTFGAATYGVFLITVDDDTDVGNIRLVLDRWPTIVVAAAHTQRGLPLGMRYAADGSLIGAPRFSLTPLQYATLKAAWPVSFVDGSGKLLPPSRMHGQIDWRY